MRSLFSRPSLAAFVASLSLVGCAAGAQTVQLSGNDKELFPLSGEWKGDYHGTIDARTGEIRFNMPMGWHSADGSVVIEPSKIAVPIVAVAVRKNEVEGQLADYQDPSCECAVSARFHGELAGEVITGAFEVTEKASGKVNSGTWEIRRVVR
jgi:hypothetical protein